MDFKTFMHKDVFTGDELLKIKIPAIPMLVDRILYEGSGMLVYGKSNAGKSLYALELAMALAKGVTFLDEYAIRRPIRVLYVQREGGKAQMIRRYQRMSHILEPCPEHIKLWYPKEKFFLNDEESMNCMVEKFKTYQPEVVILDPLNQMVKGSLTDDEVASSVTLNLNVLKYTHNICPILIHHTHKDRFATTYGGRIEEGVNSIFGSYIWYSWPDTVFEFRKDFVKDKKTGQIVDEFNTMQCVKDREAPSFWDLKLKLQATGDSLWFDTYQPNSPSDIAVISLLAKTGTMRYSDILEKAGYSDASVKRSLKRLKMNKQIEIDENKNYKLKGRK